MKLTPHASIEECILAFERALVERGHDTPRVIVFGARGYEQVQKAVGPRCVYTPAATFGRMFAEHEVILMATCPQLVLTGCAGDIRITREQA